jgi:hypothetical protein
MRRNIGQSLSTSTTPAKDIEILSSRSSLPLYHPVLSCSLSSHLKMRLASLFLTAFVATTMAQDFCVGNKDTIGYCETLSYIDRTLNATDAPSSFDCQDACRGVLSDAGDWLVDFKGTSHSPASFSQPSNTPKTPIIYACFLSSNTHLGYPVNYRQNMVGSPCGFSMGRAPGQPLNYSFSMDNQDIVDIFDEVTQRFAPLHGGKVAAEGLIKCQGFEGTWYIN